MAGETYKPRVDLCVRSLCPRGGPGWQAEIVERLNAMEEADRLADVSVHVWGERIPCDEPTGVGASMLARVESFEAWSDRAGASLSSFFERTEVGSMLVDGTRTAIVPPVGCLAEYDGDRVAFVTPCVDDGTVWTISDRLDALEEEVEADASG